MQKGFEVTDQQVCNVNETWKPVVQSKHAEVVNNFNELRLMVREKSGLMRQMELSLRVFDDGVCLSDKAIQEREERSSSDHQRAHHL